jgi:hypothetical protein
MASANLFREFLQERFIVNGLTAEDFLEVVVQGRTTVVLEVAN